MTSQDWKEIIDGYDKEKETIIAYCKRFNITDSRFYYYRDKFNGKHNSTAIKNTHFIPAKVVQEKKMMKFAVNHVALEVENSVDDDSLRRIINICTKI